MRTNVVRVVVTMFLSLAGAAASASAQWVRHHPSQCQPQRIEEAMLYAVAGAGATNTGDAHPVTLICPGFDTADQPDGGITEVRVYVSDNSPTQGFRVRACRSARDTLEGVCSEPVSTSNSFEGDTVLTLGPEQLNVWGAIGFGYLEVVIPRFRAGEWYSYFKGWQSHR